jgi:hypothetical protein
MFPAKAGVEFKSKIPDFERGKTNPPPNFGGLTTPIEIHRGRHPYVEYFED